MKLFKLTLLLLLVSLNLFAMNDRERIAFKVTYYDSLFTAQEYEEIIKECEENEINIFHKLSMDNLIAAYFFKGDTLKAQQLVKERILYYKDVSNVANNCFGSQSLGYLSFITIDTNKNFIISSILALQKTEGITDEENAKNILLFYIQDPYFRCLRDKADGKFKSLLGKDIIRKDIVDSLYSLNDRIFQFYKSTNKLFSKEEVGMIYREQTLFLMHDAQMREKGYFSNNRFYKTLVKDAINKGVFDKDYEITYAILTEVINNIGLEGYFKNKEEILTKYRKQYNSPEFVFRPV